MESSVRNYIRRMVGHFLTSTCTLQVEVTTTGSFGQNETTWSDVAANLPCRLLPAGQTDTERVVDLAGQEGINQVMRLVVAHDVALDVGQRVVMTGGDTYYVAGLLVDATDEMFRSAVIVRKVGADG